MNILFRDSRWFLYEHEGVHWVQAKEPMASKIRSMLHHSKPELMRIRSVHSKSPKCSTFRTEHTKLIQFMTIWNAETNITNTKEWLLYLYLDFCFDCCKAIHPDYIWFDENRKLIHSDWEATRVTSEESELIQKLLEYMCTSMNVESSTVPFDSAPWSLYHFIQHFNKYPTRSITRHAWWTRQELTSNRNIPREHTRLSSFSLPPPALENDPEDSIQEKDTNMNKSKPSNTFPLIKGSMIHSPKIKQFENHLNSHRIKTSSSVIHKIIRISSSFLG
jgi:hypothetical protein